jgi:hypothetical protein
VRPPPATSKKKPKTDIKFKEITFEDYLLGILITCWSHWNYHYLARRQPERPKGENKRI